MNGFCHQAGTRSAAITSNRYKNHLYIRLLLKYFQSDRPHPGDEVWLIT